jgi:hypothetical protein
MRGVMCLGSLDFGAAFIHITFWIYVFPYTVSRWNPFCGIRISTLRISRKNSELEALFAFSSLRGAFGKFLLQSHWLPRKSLGVSIIRSIVTSLDRFISLAISFFRETLFLSLPFKNPIELFKEKCV